MSITRNRQNLLSSLKTTECYSTLQSTLSRHQSSRAWRCSSVTDSLARVTRDLNQTVLNGLWRDTAVQHVPRFFFPECCSGGTMRRSWRATALRGHWECSLRMWELSTDHWWKQQLHTTDTLCRNPSICSWSFPHAYNATPLKWLKLFNRSTYSSAGYGCTLEWMLRTQFTSQSTTVTACRVKIEAQIQTSWAPSDPRWPWQINQ